MKSSILTLIALLTSVLLFNLSSQPAHAANCDGLPVTGGNLAPGTYTLADNCVTTGTLTVNAGTVTINGAGFSIDANNAFNDVLYVAGGATLNLNNVTIRGGNDDGVESLGILTTSNSTFSANVYGIFNNGGTAIVTNSTLSGNTLTGITNFNTLSITNSTLSGNNEGIYNNNGGTATIIHSTLSENTLYGANNNNGTITITNSLLSANAQNCDLTLTDGGGNLIDTANGGACTGITPLVDADPMLGGFNGSYYPLLTGSPAIDSASDCAGLTNDQIGTTRPQGSACDIGAIEVILNPVTGEVVQPSTPSLNQWNGEYPEEIRAEGFGVDDNVYATVHMQNGAWQYNAGGVPEALIDYGVIMAIDVWEQGGDQYFDTYERVCLLGEGRLIYFDATQAPRPQIEITPVDFEGGYTCGWIPNAGTLVLIEPE